MDSFVERTTQALMGIFLLVATGFLLDNYITGEIEAFGLSIAVLDFVAGFILLQNAMTTTKGQS